MKRVLITGKDSYIGTSLERHLLKFPNKFSVDVMDTKGTDWEKRSFLGCDVIFHVAGIVHKKNAPESLYYGINRDLTVTIAQKAKAQGVAQFIFMSTMSVYGKEDKMGVENCITVDTPLEPKTPYGKSKLEAEQALQEMQSETFRVCILRPPMVYGKGCPGNYGTLRKIVLKTHVIPVIKNKRSMIHIDTLCRCVHQCMEDGSQGIVCPQDKEYVNTSNMMEQIALRNGITYKKSILLGRGIEMAARVLPSLRKAFGNLTLDQSLSDIGEVYVENNFEELIGLTERQVV